MANKEAEMTKSRFDRNFVFVGQSMQLPTAQVEMMDDQRKAGNYVEWNLMYDMQDSAVEGSFGMGGSWVMSLKGTKPVQIELAHTHDCDEILGLLDLTRITLTSWGERLSYGLKMKNISSPGAVWYSCRGE